MRPVLILAVSILAILPAAAGEPAPGKGRYAVAPSDEGFIRLDTETGATTHCGRRDGVWKCDTLAEDRTALEGRISALSERVGTLAAEVDRLAKAVATLSERQAAGAISSRPDPAAAAPAAPPAGARLLDRFQDMLRALQRGV